MAAKRKGISKRLRFEVFKRDSFRCQYCGKAAPDVILQCDHLSPVSKGGDTDLLNLITSCADCNAGKSDVELSDDTAIQKQRAQLEALNERREQLEMMLEWRQGLSDLDQQTIEAVASAWSSAARGYYLNDRGIQGAKKLVRQYGAQAVLESIEVAATSYLKLDDEGKPSAESVEIAWKKVGGILRMRDQPEWKRQLYYIRGILRNRLSYVDYRNAMNDMERAVYAGVDVEYIKRLALDARSWTQFENWLWETIKEHEGEGDGAG